MQNDSVIAIGRMERSTVLLSISMWPSGGDIWLWIALCPETKLVVSWRLGCRGIATAIPFMHDLRNRLRHRIQLSTDGHDAYLEAVEAAFGKDIDYARTVMLTDRITDRKSTVVQVISGNPHSEHHLLELQLALAVLPVRLDPRPFAPGRTSQNVLPRHVRPP